MLTIYKHCEYICTYVYMYTYTYIIIYVHMQCCCGDVHRNERDTALAKVAHKLTKDPDLFLGEKVIEVRRVGAPRDVWYKLGKRARTCTCTCT